MFDFAAQTGGALVLYFMMLIGMLLFSLAVYVVTVIFLSKVFAKAGVTEKWRAWVPIYNMMVLSKLGDLSPWLVLYCFGGALLLTWIGIGFLFSLAMWAVTGMAAYRVGMKLGKEPALTALWIIPVAWIIFMGLSKDSWNSQVAPAPWASNGFLADKTDWAGVPQQASAEAASAAPEQTPPPVTPVS